MGRVSPGPHPGWVPQSHTRNPRLKPVVKHVQVSGTMLGARQGHKLAGEAGSRGTGRSPFPTPCGSHMPVQCPTQSCPRPLCDSALLGGQHPPPPLGALLAPAAPPKGSSLWHSLAWRGWEQMSFLLLPVPPLKLTAL